MSCPLEREAVGYSVWLKIPNGRSALQLFYSICSTSELCHKLHLDRYCAVIS